MELGINLCTDFDEKLIKDMPEIKARWKMYFKI